VPPLFERESDAARARPTRCFDLHACFALGIGAGLLDAQQVLALAALRGLLGVELCLLGGRTASAFCVRSRSNRISSSTRRAGGSRATRRATS